MIELPKDLVDEIVDSLERVECQFFACEGPNKRPVSMKTCHRCWTLRKLYKWLSKE